MRCELYGMKKNFYTYGYLSYPDNILYYIGKGKNNRAYAKHERVPVPEDKDLIIFFNDDLTTHHKEPQYFTEEQAFELEIKCIAKYGRMDMKEGYLLNGTEGGEGTSGYKHTEETKRKLSKPKSKETKRLISEAQKGKKHTEETKRLISEAQKGNQYGLGYKHTEEAKRLMSEAHKGNNEAQVAWYKTQTKVKCDHCSALRYKHHITQYHNDNCKMRYVTKLPF